MYNFLPLMQKPNNLPNPEKRSTWQKAFLLTVCLGISLFGWLRFTGALNIYTLLLELGLKPHPLYYLLSGLTIGLSFLAAFFVSALNGKKADQYVRSCSILLALHFLIEIFFIRHRVNSIHVILVLAVSFSLIILTTRNHHKNEFTP